VRTLSTLALALALVPLAAYAAPTAASVVGGSAISIQSAPWAVVVEYRDAPDSYYHCTGSIIDTMHVVTAAYCLYTQAGTKAGPGQVMVFAGTSNSYAPAATDEQQIRRVASYHIHPAYVFGGPGDRDDVAVLTVAQPFDLGGSSVRAVALPSAGRAFPARVSVELAGYGRQAASVSSPGQLVRMTATVEPQGDCGAWSSSIARENGVVFCLGSARSTTCSGDGGAGVVAGGVLLGVTGLSVSGSCAAGDDVVAASLVAPELLAFVRGSSAPPSAPRSSSSARLRWKGPVRVGTTLTCSAGSGWRTPVRVVYTFVTADAGRVLQSGVKATYRVARRALRASIRCRALVANDGGTLLVQTNASPNVVARKR
jgi:elastase-2